MMDVLPWLLYAVYNVLCYYTHGNPGERDATDFAVLFLYSAHDVYIWYITSCVGSIWYRYSSMRVIMICSMSRFPLLRFQ